MVRGVSVETVTHTKHCSLMSSGSKMNWLHFTGTRGKAFSTGDITAGFSISIYVNVPVSDLIRIRSCVLIVLISTIYIPGLSLRIKTFYLHVGGSGHSANANSEISQIWTQKHVNKEEKPDSPWEKHCFRKLHHVQVWYLRKNLISYQQHRVY